MAHRKCDLGIRVKLFIVVMEASEVVVAYLRFII
jgi:hypothetical protein